MKFDKTRWSCSCNSDQNCTQNSAGVEGGLGVVGVQVVAGLRGYQGQGVGESNSCLM